MRGWAIDRDYDNAETARGGVPNRVGYGQTLTEHQETLDAIPLRRITVRDDLFASDVEEPVRFRIVDCDGHVYYGGAVSLDWIIGEDDLAYNIDQFGQADVGGDVQFRACDLPDQMAERHRLIGATVTDGGTEWAIIYG